MWSKQYAFEFSYILVHIFICYIFKNHWKIYLEMMNIFLSISYFRTDFRISYAIRRFYLLYNQCRQTDRIFLYPVNFSNKCKSELCNLLVCVIAIFTQIIFSCVLLERNFIGEVMTVLMSFCLIVIAFFISSQNKNDIREQNQLEIGYGAALAYYKNYLEYFVPYALNERIENFKTKHHVNVEKKLFILAPKSCKIPRYINEPGTIERCRELSPQIITQGGIKDRVYNITVYLINPDSNGKELRMAVEYAQPLKALFNFKQKKIITEEEMYYQHKLFVKNLQEFLKDDKDSYKFCEIVEYNDEKIKVSEVLSEHCNNFHHEIV